MGTAAGEGEGCRRKSPPSREDGAHRIHVCVVRSALALFLVHMGTVSYSSDGTRAC